MKRKKSIQDKHSPINTIASIVSHTRSPLISHYLERFFAPIVLGLLTFIVYFPTRNYPFHFDDLANITKNFNIRTFNVWKKMLSSQRWFGEWLNALIFKINGFNPLYYRIANMIMHTLGGILVFYLVSRLLERLPKSSFLSVQRTAIAMLTSLLFLLHPVQTQTVSYAIQGKLEGVASILLLASLILLIHVARATTFSNKLCFFLLGIIPGVIACGTKEIAIVAPFLFILIDWFFIAQQKWSSFKTRLWLHVIYALIIFSVMVYYLKPAFFLRVFKLNSSLPNNRGNILTAHAADKVTPFAFFMSEFRVLIHYLVIFLWPFGISVEYDWKLCENFFEPAVLFPFLILALLAIIILHRYTRKHHAYISFGLLWFFITMAPRTTLIPSPELVCDYKTYLASFGWLFILAIGLVKLIAWTHNHFFSSHRGRTVYYAFLLVLTAILCSSTAQRNKVWSSGRAFWRDIVVKAPEKARAHNNYGVELVKEANDLLKNRLVDSARHLYTKAITYYKNAITLDAVYPDPYSNLSVCYSLLERDQDAIDIVKQALKMFPNYPEAFNNLGSLYLKNNRFAEAEDAFKKAIRVRPYYGKAYFNMARLYSAQGKDEDAWNALKKASEGDFDTVHECFYALGQVSMKLAKYDEAEKAFQKLLTFHKGTNSPLEINSYFNIANALFMKKKYDEAEHMYTLLTQKTPGDSRFWHNLGEVKTEKNKYEEALLCYQNATKCRNCLVQTHMRLALCQEHLNNYDDAIATISHILTADTDNKLPNELRANIEQELSRLKLQAKINKDGRISVQELNEALHEKTTT